MVQDVFRGKGTGGHAENAVGLQGPNSIGRKILMKILTKVRFIKEICVNLNFLNLLLQLFDRISVRFFVRICRLLN